MFKASLLSVAITGMLGTASQAAAAETSFADVQAWLTEFVQAPVDGLAPGDYSQDRIAQIAAYLAPGYIDNFDFPEHEFELVETRHYEPHHTYQEATARYGDKATINDGGQI